MTTSQQQTKVSHFTTKIGEIEVVSVQDGLLYVPLTVLKPDDDPKEQERMEQTLPNPLVWSNNVFLVRLEKQLILIDVGGGDLFAPESGQLIPALAAIGLRPKDITDICLTHLHPDHIGGLVMNGQVAFPDATLHVSNAELDYWLAADSRANAPEHHSVFFEALDQKFLPYYHDGRVKAFEAGRELFHGLQTYLLPGHTPGLTAFVLTSKDKKLTFWGDLFNEPAQVHYPNLRLIFDWNSEMAIETRHRALEQAAVEGALVAPPHASFPGFFKIEKDALTYRLRQVELPAHGSSHSDTASR